MASIYDNIPHLRNVVLTETVRMNRIGAGALAGERIMPDRNVVSRKTEWDRTYGARLLAPIVAPTTATPLVKSPGADRVSAEAVDIREKFSLEEKDVLFMMDPGMRESTGGRSQWADIEDHLNRMRGQVLARREQLVWDTLTSGSTTYDAMVDGERIVTTVDYGVPAANSLASGSVAWSSAGTANPKGDFRAQNTMVRNKTGRSLKTAWMNTNTHGVLDVVSGLTITYLNRENSPQDLVKSEFTTDIIANIRIVDYDEGHFGEAASPTADDNGTGTFQFFIPDNRVVFLVTQTGRDTDGEPFADFAVAPSYLADESIVQGLFSERFTTFDPTRTYIRVGLVGIPRIFHPEWFVSFDITAGA